MSLPIHDDHITWIERPEDVCYLRTPLLPVSIRLWGSSPGYRAVVESCIAHITKAVLTQCSGYKLPHGMSGANLGIPFNVIARAVHRGTPKARAEVMINPKIVNQSGAHLVSDSNCGSIRLAEPIKVKRRSDVLVEWWDVNRRFHRNWRDREWGSLTIQHEVDHNLGILITDPSRAVPVPEPEECQSAGYSGVEDSTGC